MNKIIMLTGLLGLFSLSPLYAKYSGHEGGGGDASELRVDEIRSDLLKWINSGEAQGLNFPVGMSYEDYTKKMADILSPKHVIVNFTEQAVKINNVEKTCIGFIQSENEEAHILCNISRFADTPDDEQYALIHHEYAGLALIEENKGAASDYIISSQLSEFLVEQPVLKLGVKQKNRVEWTSKGQITCLAGDSEADKVKVFEADLLFKTRDHSMMLNQIKYAKTSTKEDVENLTAASESIKIFSIRVDSNEMKDLILGSRDTGIILVIKDNYYTTAYGTQFEVKCMLEK